LWYRINSIEIIISRPLGFQIAISPHNGLPLDTDQTVEAMFYAGYDPLANLIVILEPGGVRQTGEAVIHELSGYGEFWLDFNASQTNSAEPAVGENMVGFPCLLINIIHGIQGRLVVERRMFLSSYNIVVSTFYM
jgi:hypothetical protein